MLQEMMQTVFILAGVLLSILLAWRYTTTNTKILARTNHTAPLVIGIVDEHNCVLKFWVDAYRNKQVPEIGLPLLHVDSHSDGSLPFNEYQFQTKNENPTPNTEELIKNTNIGDFIPVAQYIGILDTRTLWVQRNWSDQAGLHRIGVGFNFPPGNYSLVLKKREHWDVSDFENDMMIDERQTFLCYKNSHGILLDGNLTDRGLHNLPRKRGLCDDDTHDNEKEVKWFVRHVQEHESYTFVNELIGPKNSPYILDIDLDYFATYTPVISNVASIELNGHYFEYLRRLLTNELCLDTELPDMKKSEEYSYLSEKEQIIQYNTRRVNRLLKQIAYEGLLFLSKEGRKKYAKYKYISTFNQNTMKLWCNGQERGQKVLEQVTKLFTLFTVENRFFHVALLRSEYEFPSIECNSNYLFGICHYTDISHPDVTRGEILEEMEKLRFLIRERGTPAVVTVARSQPDYTPPHLYKFIEYNLLNMLQDEFANVDIQYYDGLSPVEPTFDISPVSTYNQTLFNEVEESIQALSDQEVVNLYKKNQKKLKQMTLLRKYMDEQEISILDVAERAEDFVNWAEYQMQTRHAHIPKTSEEVF